LIFLPVFALLAFSAFVSHSKIAHYYSIDDETPHECSMGTLNNHATARDRCEKLRIFENEQKDLTFGAMEK
jgi:hypothetical protein